MKHSNEDIVLQTNLLQAFQKNKLIQGKLNERQHSYYVQLVKDMQEYKIKEKINKELLYTWKKENYVRQLKKNLREYERKRFGARDAYYEYQARNLDCILTGQQGLAIPPREEERRLNVKAKVDQFIKEHPVRTKTPVRQVKSVEAVIDHVKHKKEEENTRAVEETWKSIHAQSAVGLKRRKRDLLPRIQRSITMDVIPQNKSTTKNFIPSTTTTAAALATAPTTVETDVPIPITNPEQGSVTSEKKRQVGMAEVRTIRSAASDDMEPIKIESDILQKQSGNDLVVMRSVRRPQKNPIDLNMVFESRKRIYQINKRVYDYQLCHRKCGLQYNTQFDRPAPIHPLDDDQNLLVEMSEATRKRYEDRHQADKNII